MAGTLCAKTALRAWCPAMTRDESLRIFAVRNRLWAEIAAAALRGKKNLKSKNISISDACAAVANQFVDRA
jgi:hypothetical protein